VWPSRIGETVDAAKGAAHLEVEAVGRHVDVLRFDLELTAIALAILDFHGMEQLRSDTRVPIFG